MDTDSRLVPLESGSWPAPDSRLAPEDLGTWPARVRLHVMDPTFRPVSVAPGYRPNSAASVHHQDFRGQGYPWTQMPAHPYKPKH